MTAVVGSALAVADWVAVAVLLVVAPKTVVAPTMSFSHHSPVHYLTLTLEPPAEYHQWSYLQGHLTGPDLQISRSSRSVELQLSGPLAEYQ